MKHKHLFLVFFYIGVCLIAARLKGCCDIFSKDMQRLVLITFFELNPIKEYKHFKTSFIFRRVSKAWRDIISDIQGCELKRQQKKIESYCANIDNIPLHLAISYGYYSYLYHLFLQNPKLLNCRIKCYSYATESLINVPLICYSSNNVISLDFLLALGADINARDDVNHSILDIAIRHGRTDLAKKLISAGAKLSYSNMMEFPRFKAKALAYQMGNHDLVTFIDQFQRHHRWRSFKKLWAEKIRSLKDG